MSKSIHIALSGEEEKVLENLKSDRLASVVIRRLLKAYIDYEAVVGSNALALLLKGRLTMKEQDAD